MKKVRAKFKCTKAGSRGKGDEKVHSYEFDAVVGGSPENDEFWKWTPSGSLSLDAINER